MDQKYVIQRMSIRNITLNSTPDIKELNNYEWAELGPNCY